MHYCTLLHKMNNGKHKYAELGMYLERVQLQSYRSKPFFRNAFHLRNCSVLQTVLRLKM
jgi:hypothetical protein